MAVLVGATHGTLESQMKAAEYALWKTMNETWEALGQLWPILNVPLWFAVVWASIIALSLLFALWSILWNHDYHIVKREGLGWDPKAKQYVVTEHREVRPGPAP